jgi:hypothetical protein
MALNIVNLLKEEQEENRENNKKIYIRIVDADEEETETTTEKGNIIKTVNRPFEYTGRVAFIRQNYVATMKDGKKFNKTVIYLADHNLEEHQDKTLVLDFGYDMFIRAVELVGVERDDRIKVAYLGKYKKAVKEYPELQEVFNNPNPNMKIFDIEKLD